MFSFMQISTKIDGFEQKDSQGFENSYNSYEHYPLEKFFIFTIYQNYTLALITADWLLYPRIHVVYKGVCRNQRVVGRVPILRRELLPQFLTNSHQI